MAEFTKGLSLYPQQVKRGLIWYYENAGSIEVFICGDEIRKHDGGFSFKIPRYRLERSLKRMQPALAKAESRFK